MKYIVTAMICTMIGAITVPLYAEYGFYGHTKDGTQEPEPYLDSVDVFCEVRDSVTNELWGTVTAKTKYHTDPYPYHYFKFSISGSVGESWHKYVPGTGYKYKFRAHKDDYGGCWDSEWTGWYYYPWDSEDVTQILHWFPD